MTNNHIRLTDDNFENHIGRYDESKGALLKYRFSNYDIEQYDLIGLDNNWHYGILCDVSYIEDLRTTQYKYGDILTVCHDLMKAQRFYDLWVWKISDGGKKETIGLNSHDVYLVKP